VAKKEVREDLREAVSLMARVGMTRKAADKGRKAFKGLGRSGSSKEKLGLGRTSSTSLSAASAGHSVGASSPGGRSSPGGMSSYDSSPGRSSPGAGASPLSYEKGKRAEVQ
jgi:hypothetical protein